METNPINEIADSYVNLGLQFHVHDRNPFIYIGHDQDRQKVQTNALNLSEIDLALRHLRDQLMALPAQDVEEHGRFRQHMLLDRVDAMLMRGTILRGVFPNDFESEASALYGLSVSLRGEAHFASLTAELDTVMPGTGSLADRVSAFRDLFLLSKKHIPQLIETTMQEARKRAHANMDLPSYESVVCKFSEGGPYVAFASYQGAGQTTVQFNVGTHIHLDRVIELCVHEAYPGHHIQGTLIESELIQKRGWREFSLAPLFGAITSVLEGAANYGVSLSFTADERLAYDADVLLPIAGMTHLRDELPRFHRFVSLVEELNHARNVAAKNYLYGRFSKQDTIDWLKTFALETDVTAAQRVAFFDAMRSYVVTYNLGLDWVKNRIESHASTRSQRWDGLKKLLIKPDLPMSQLM